jgi:hypothetical protein
MSANPLLTEISHLQSVADHSCRELEFLMKKSGDFILVFDVGHS